MSEIKFIKGLGKGQCYVIQRGEEYVVRDRWDYEGKNEHLFDNLLKAIVYAQENFGVVNFHEPLAFKNPGHE